MQDRDAAKTLSGGGKLNALNETTSEYMQVSGHPASRHKQAGGPASLQRILVVEDDASLASLEAGILSAHGYAVVIANSGELAISALQQGLPDLVLLDLDLSGAISGWDVLRVLRTYSQTPVLLTSAASAVRHHIRTRGESRSTLDHLPKPYPMQTLLKRVERMLTIAP